LEATHKRESAFNHPGDRTRFHSELIAIFRAGTRFYEPVSMVKIFWNEADAPEDADPFLPEHGREKFKSTGD
jgi:hypothetical protein